MFLIYVSSLISFFYLLLICIFIVGWKRLTVFVPSASISITDSITVIVCCRNEELNLPKLLSCLAQQSFQKFQLIMVDDHSTDNTLSIMKSVTGAFSDIMIIEAAEYGKKAALKTAVKSANSNLIVTTDADCLPSFHWLETIVSYSDKYPSELLICPVRLATSDSLFSKLQSLEFSSLVASGASASGAGMPILCNGANLVFTKMSWLKSQYDLHTDELSGDDVFLLQSIKRRGGKIRFLKSESAFVATKAPTSVFELIRQRQRWASKAPSYTDWQLIFTSSIVFSISLLAIVLLGFSLFHEGYWILFLTVTILKFLVDATFMFTVRSFFQLEYVWWYSFLLSLIYPFYIVFVALAALLFKPKIWK